MPDILIPGYLRWNGNKFTTEPDVAIVGPKGIAGELGPQGIQGAQGIQGIQGIQGERGTGTLELSGDLTGDMDSQMVIGLKGDPLNPNLETIGSEQDGYSLVWNNSDGYWEAAKAFIVGGDLIGDANSQTINTIQGKNIDSNLEFIGSAQDGYSIVWDEGNNYWKVAPAFAPGGDLSGSAINQIVTGIRGKLLDSNLATVGAEQDGYSLTWDNSNDYWKAAPAFVASGDLSGTSDIQIVSGIREKLLDTNLATIGAEQDGYSLTWDNGNDFWRALPAFAPGGDLTGTIISQTINKIQGKALDSALSSIGAANDGYSLVWDNSNLYWKANNIFSPAGDLSGTKITQSVIKIKGNTLDSNLGSLGAAEDGYSLVWDYYGTNSWVMAQPSSSILLWGSGSIGTGASGDGYLWPKYWNSTMSSASLAIAIPRSGFVRNMRVTQVAGTGTGSVIYVLKKGTGGVLLVQLNATDTSGEDTFAAVSVTQGNLLRLYVTFTDIVTSPTNIRVSVEYL